MVESVNKANEDWVVQIPRVYGALDGETVKERLTEACDRMGRKAVDCESRNENYYMDGVLMVFQRGQKAKMNTASSPWLFPSCRPMRSQGG